MISAFARNLRRRTETSDEGFAIMAVIMLMLVMLLVSSVVVAAVVSGGTFQRKQQDWNAALAAAQAGVDDYIQRLNASNGDYYQYDGVNQTDPVNDAMGMTGTQPKFAALQQIGGTSQRGSYHYWADTTAYIGTQTVAQTGTIVVTSTGKVGNRTRTIQAQVRRSGFLDNLYFSEYETQDPAQSGDSTCALKHYYDGRPSGCTSIAFANDVLDGPVASNDTILICNNVTFKGEVKSATPAIGGKYYRNNCGSAYPSTPAPVFKMGVPQSVDPIPVPSTNQSLKQQTNTTASPRGCLFVGPTTITIKGNQIFVHSPWTKDTPVCQLDQWINIPVNGTIYVDDRPANGTTDPNSWTSTAASAVQSICNTNPGGGGAGNPVGYPVAGEKGWTYGCTDGDVFIQDLNGSSANGLSGRMTVAAAGSIYVTDNLYYANSSAMLGLIANQNVWYWHGTTDGNKASSTDIKVPAKQNPTQPAKGSALTNLNVSAAMVALKHSIGTMNPAGGDPLGVLTINGNITQLYRGIVSTGGNGYKKNYVYDRRLKYDAPPHFLNPTTSTFITSMSAELPGYRPSR